MHQVQCPNPQCDKSYNVDAQKIGKRLKCQCGEMFRVDGSGMTQSFRKKSVPVPGDNPDAWPQEQLSSRPPLPTTASNRRASNQETSAQSTPETTADMPQQIGRFEIQSVLGAGAFGKVYRARDPLMDRQVALKVPLASTFQSEEALLRFLREAQTAGQLHHPNIVTIYEVAEHEGQIYIASAFIEGRTLDAAIKQGDLDFNQAVAITRQLAEALDYAHGEGIIHRDIKPANIMLDKEGRPHILDFGLARLSDEREKLTHAESAIGTPAYMPPEQAQGKSAHEVGAHSDQYSLGVVLYEMLTGQRPFSGPVDVVLLNVIKSEPPTPRSLRADIPRDLETICQKAMSKDPNYRYASSGELGEDLERWQENIPIRARRISPPERLYRWSKRNPLIAGLTAAVFLVILIGFITSSAFAVAANRRAESERLAKEAEQAAKEKEQNAKKAERQAREKESEALGRSNVMLAYSEIQHGSIDFAKRLLDECAEKSRRWEWFYARRMCDDSERTISNSGVFQIVGSPDGKRIATNNGRNEVRVLDTASGKQLHVFQNSERVESMAFNLSGTILVTGGNTGEIAVWSMESGAKTLTGKNNAKIESVTISGDNRLIASCDAKGVLKVWSSSEGKLVTIRTLPDADAVILAFRPAVEDRKLALANSKHEIHLLDTKSGTSKQLGRMDGSVTDIAWDSSGRFLAMSDSKGNAAVYDIEKEEVVGGFSHSSAINGIAVSRDGQFLIGGGEDGALIIRDVHGLAIPSVLRGHTGPILSIAYSPEIDRIITCGADRSSRYWKPDAVGESISIAAHTGSIQSLSFDPTGKKLVSCAGKDGSARVWDANSGEQLLAINTGWRGLFDAEFHPDGYQIATCFVGSVDFWDARKGTKTGSLNATSKNAALLSLAYSPNGKQLATGGSSVIKIWDLTTETAVVECKGSEMLVKVAFSPDGRRIAGGELTGTIPIWDVASGKIINKLEAGDDIQLFGTIAFSPDGELLAGGLGKIVRVWNAESGELVYEFEGHLKDVTSLQFFPDGARLLSAGDDGTIRFWNLGDGRLDFTLRGVVGRASQLAVSPDGRRIAAGLSVGFNAGLIQVWDAGEAARVLVADRAAVRSRTKTAGASDHSAAAGISGKGPVRSVNSSNSSTVTRNASGNGSDKGSESLTGRVTFTWRNGKLSTFMESLRKKPGIHFEYDPSELAAAGIDLDQKVNFRVIDVSWDDLFHIMFDRLGVDVAVQGKTVTLKPALRQRPELPTE